MKNHRFRAEFTGRQERKRRPVGLEWYRTILTLHVVPYGISVGRPECAFGGLQCTVPSVSGLEDC